MPKNSFSDSWSLPSPSPKWVAVGLLLLLPVLSPLGLNAEESMDSVTRLRSESIEAKQKRMEDLARQAEAAQKQAAEERQGIKSSEQKIWKEFSQSLEVERREMKNRLETLDERQRMFDAELQKKRQQDELRVQEKEAEAKRLMAQMDRLREEVAIDKKDFEQSMAAARKNRSQVAEVGNMVAEGEKLENKTLKISGFKGQELMGATPFKARTVRPEYYLEVGDILMVDVWRSPDISRSVTVRPDGRISMPLVGDLDILGLNLVQVKTAISQKLSEYIRDPQVSLSIQQFGGRKFILLGEVSSPGVYRFQQDISLLEGIALAGGFKPTAKRGKIMIIRGDIHKDPQVKIISANLANVLQRGVLTENLTIMTNDIIYVAKDFLGDYNDVINDLIKPSVGAITDFFVVRSAMRTALAEKG